MPIGNDFFPQFSEQEFARRHQAVRAAMKDRGLDCLLIYGAYSYAGTDTGQFNVVYLANYAGINHSYLVFPGEDDPTVIICNANHVPNARDISVIPDVRAGGMDLVPGVVQRLKELGLEQGRIGLVGPLPTWWTHTIPVEHHSYLTQALPGIQIEVVTAWYENLHLIKSDEEIRLMERAGALTDLAYEELFLATRPGVRHTDLRRVIEGVAHRFGGKFPFSHVSSTALAHPHQCYPDFYPTDRTVSAGEMVMTELSLGYGLYFGKLWGCYFVGEPTQEYRDYFELAVAVHDRAIAELKPGMTGRDVNAWLQPFKKLGYINAAPLVNGWSNYNHAPHFGAIDGTPVSKRVYPADLDFVMEPGHCLGIRSYPVSADLKRGLWLGTTCVMTKDGLRRLHNYPVTTLRVVPT